MLSPPHSADGDRSPDRESPSEALADDPLEAPDVPRSPGSGRTGVLPGSVAGVVSALVAIAVAEVVAGLFRGGRSPMLDVGDRVIDLVPVTLKTFAISLFGTNDKLALLIGIGVLVAAFAALVGVVTFRGHPALGISGIALFSVAGMAAGA